ncbi:hypothetical protein [Clostridium tetani]|uniref:Uncharacterized protein n=1 Tax=Clostridium tetani TaxID=1513 RepID=A0ABC8EGV6_CLOTA|nr:hypothetical protein [Clostridium tetani]BDR82563.1 hypothetical protein K234311028_p20460 [Clostridium tetani]
MEKSGFFNAMKVGDTWDRIYKAENFAEYFATFIGNGVFPNPATGLQVIETDKMQVTIKKGKAWINGFIYINTDDLIIPIDVADGVLNRIDKIVLRYDTVKREIRVKVKNGNFASSPIEPLLQRDADAYELALADIKVSAGAIKITQADITDLRLNKSMCGIVHGTVEQVDTTTIFNQFQSWYTQKQKQYDDDITKWTKEKKEAFDKWYIENTTAFMNKFNKWYRENTTEWENDFNTWFESIKGQLDGDVAAKLTAKTIELENKIDNIEVPVKSVNGKTGEIELKAGDIKTSCEKSIEQRLDTIYREDTKSIMLYVDGVNGLDSNSGLSKSHPLLTLEKAFANIPTVHPNVYIEIIGDIQIKNDITLYNKFGNGLNLKLYSNNGSSIKGTKKELYFDNIAWITISDLIMDNVIVSSRLSSYVDVTKVTFKKQSFAVCAYMGGHVNVSNCTFENVSSACIYACGGVIHSSDNVGTAKFGLIAREGGVISKQGTQPSGTTSNEYTTNGGVIR